MPRMSTADISIGEAADPAELGFSAERLARIDRHLDRYVDDGRRWSRTRCGASTR
jgi:hypothetical protein